MLDAGRREDVKQLARGNPLIAHMAAAEAARGHDVGSDATSVLRRFLKRVSIAGPTLTQTRILAAIAVLGPVTGDEFDVLQDLNVGFASPDSPADLVADLIDTGLVLELPRGFVVKPDRLGPVVVADAMFSSSPGSRVFGEALIGRALATGPLVSVRVMAARFSVLRDAAMVAGTTDARERLRAVLAEATSRAQLVDAPHKALALTAVAAPALPFDAVNVLRNVRPSGRWVLISRQRGRWAAQRRAQRRRACCLMTTRLLPRSRLTTRRSQVGTMTLSRTLKALAM